jgi:hypothetical protein
MNQRMAEIRFPRRGRDSARRGASEDVAPDPLAEMATQIRELDAAAERVATRIAEAANGLRDRERNSKSATRADLLAGLASALVDRTGEIRSDCGRLSALMERTARLIGDAPSQPPPSKAPPSTGPAKPAESVVSVPQAEPAVVEPVSAPPPTTAAVTVDEPDRPEQFEDAADEAPEQADAEKPKEAEGFEDPDGASADRPDPEAFDQPDPESFPPEPPPTPTAAVPRPRWLARRESEVPPAGTSEGVRLIATQMAIAGSSRGEIERRLRIQFGVNDADRALDEIFGNRSSGVG